MHILKTLKPIRMNGEIVPPGQIVKAIDGQGLIENGYARQLTKEETGDILNAYVMAAKDIFMDKFVPRTKNKTMIQKRLF